MYMDERLENVRYRLKIYQTILLQATHLSLSPTQEPSHSGYDGSKNPLKQA
jgi:hypothetical protein